MLRLEKVSRTREIYITIPQQEAAFNKTFLKALGLALGLHLFAFLVFHISPFKIGYADSTFAPIAVALDLGPSHSEQTSLARAEIDEENHIPPYLQIPIHENPETLIDLPIAYSKIEIEASPLLPARLLASPEDHPYLPLAFLSMDAPIHVEAPFSFHISGELANLSLLSNSPLDDLAFRLYLTGKTIHQSLDFDLLIDPKGGILFTDCLSLCEEDLEQPAEEAIRKLQFATPGRIMAGKIHLTFNLQGDWHD